MDTPTRTVGASVVDRRRSAEVDSFGDIVGQSGGFRQAVQRARLAGAELSHDRVIAAMFGRVA